MIGFKLTKDTIKNHFRYGKWIYLLIAIAIFGLTEVLFPMTAYRPPAEHKTDIAVVGFFNDTAALTKIAETIMLDPQSIDPVLEQVSIDGIMYSGDPEQDMYGATNFQVKLAAAVYDVYFLSENLKDQLVEMEGILPFNDLSDSSMLTPFLPEALEGEMIYALPLSNFPMLMENDLHYDPTDKYAVIAASSKNPELAAKVLARVLDSLREGS